MVMNPMVALLAALSAAPSPAAVTTPFLEEAPAAAPAAAEADLPVLVDYEDASPADSAAAAGNRALACVLTFGVLGAFTAAVTAAAGACLLSVLLGIASVYLLLEAAVLVAGIAMGAACGSCAVSGVFGLVGAGLAGIGGYLRSVGLWSYEAQMVFNTMMSIVRIVL